MQSFLDTSMQELEFLAEEELVEILPRMRIDRLHFISGTFGPFAPSMPVKVPLWLALALKEATKCDIQCPEWMTAEALRNALEFERENSMLLHDLPSFYVEMATLILDAASEDLPDAERIRQLVRDVEETRSEKLRQGRDSVLRGAQGGQLSTLIKLTNISCLEGQLLRNDFLPVLDEIAQQTEAQAAVTKRAQAAAAAAASAAAAPVGGRQLGTGPPSAAAGMPQRAGGLRSRFNVQAASAAAPADAAGGAAAAAASFAASTPPRIVSGVAAVGDMGDASPPKRGRGLEGAAASSPLAAASDQGEQEQQSGDTSTENTGDAPAAATGTSDEHPQDAQDAQDDAVE